MFKDSDDYWERTSKKYEEYTKKPTTLDADGKETEQAPQLMRSGIEEFRNNRNYLSAEYWEEFYDGTLMKKIVNDNGYGTKVMKQIGQRLDIDKIEGIKKITDEKGYFKCFKDKDGIQYTDIKELIEKSKGYLSWQYENETIEDLSEGMSSRTKKGKDFSNGEEWNNFQTYD